LTEILNAVIAGSFPDLDEPCTVEWLSFYSRWNNEAGCYEIQPHANIFLSDERVTEALLGFGTAGIHIPYGEETLAFEFDEIMPLEPQPDTDPNKLFVIGFDKEADTDEVSEAMYEHFDPIATVMNVIVPRNFARQGAVIVEFEDEIAAGLVLRVAKITTLDKWPTYTLTCNWAKAQVMRPIAPGGRRRDRRR
jgi:hypothetical protein